MKKNISRIVLVMLVLGSVSITGNQALADAVGLRVVCDNPMNIVVGSRFIDPGADTHGSNGELFESVAPITVSGTVDTNTEGTYTVTYSATDNLGTVSTVSRTVNVIAMPTEAHLLAVYIGKRCGGAYLPDPLPEDFQPMINVMLPEYRVGMGLDKVKDIIAETEVVGVFDDGLQAVIPSVPADITGFDSSTAIDEETVTQSAYGITSTSTIKIIADITPPSVNVTGPAYILQGASFADKYCVPDISDEDCNPDLANGTIYVYAYDKWIEGDAGATRVPYKEPIAIERNGTVDTSIPGTYTLTYTATDQAGNTATSNPFPVTVVPSDTAPTVTVEGDSVMNINQGSVFSDPGASSSDVFDGEAVVVGVGTVDINTPGTYTITYSATNSIGNTATATRTVHVIAPASSGSVAVQGGGGHGFAILPVIPTAPIETSQIPKDPISIPIETKSDIPAVIQKNAALVPISHTSAEKETPSTFKSLDMPAKSDAVGNTLSANVINAVPNDTKSFPVVPVASGVGVLGLAYFIAKRFLL